MNVTLVKLLRNKMIPAFLSVALGLMLIVARRAALDLLVRVIGGMLLAGGVAFVLLYFCGPFRDSLQLAAAALAVIAGVFFLTNAEIIVNLFPAIMGIVLILNGMSNLMESAIYRQDRLVTGCMSAIVILCGAIILFHPGAVADAIVLYVGISYVISGVADLIMLHRVKSILRGGI